MGAMGVMGCQGAIVLVLVVASCVYILRRLLAQSKETGGCSCGAAKQCAARKLKK